MFDFLQDLTGQNSNDSSSGGGPAPGTPNSQGMRPTPSPTGSSGSRSMSPAVGKLYFFDVDSVRILVEFIMVKFTF